MLVSITLISLLLPVLSFMLSSADIVVVWDWHSLSAFIVAVSIRVITIAPGMMAPIVAQVLVVILPNISAIVRDEH